MQSSTDARNGTTWFSYDDAGRVVSTTTPEPGNGQLAQATSTVFDTQGRALRVTQPDGTTVTNEYTLAGQLKKTYGSRAYPVEYTFDAQGRMKTMKTWQDFTGNSGTATTTWYYDTLRGWLTNKAYQGGLGTTYTNTPAGRLKWRLWARGTNTTYSYTAKGDLASWWYSDTTPGVTNVYDALGRLVAVTNGTVVCLRSNNLAGTLLSEKWLGGSLDGWWVTNHFDSLQRRDILQVFSGSSGQMKHEFAYDNASRLTRVWQTNHEVGYTYLANSPLVAQVGFTNNGTGILTTTKQYDFLNRLTTIASVGTGSTPSQTKVAYRYNAANQRVQANREDGAYWRYEYDKLGQVVAGKKYWNDGTPVPGMQFEYGFDDIGNRKSTAAGGNQSGAGFRPATYGANHLNQYTNRTVPGGFDVLGAASATNSVTVNGSPADYRHGEFFQELLTVNNTNAAIWQTVRVTNTTSGAYETGAVFLAQSPESFTHDSDGNLTQDGRWDYTWDGENRLIQMETRSAAYNAGAPRQKLVFGYDWQGRRISKVVSNYVSGAWSRTADLRFVYDGWNLLAILISPSFIAQQFMWGLDLSGSLQGAGGVGGLVKVYDASTGKSYFPAYDGNGNVMALLDSDSAAEAARYEYGPFGEAQVMTGSYALSNPFRFSTKFTDGETGMLYYGFRYYIPHFGRWASRDPLGEVGGTALYGLAANQPPTSVDSLGLCKVCSGPLINYRTDIASLDSHQTDGGYQQLADRMQRSLEGRSRWGGYGVKFPRITAAGPIQGTGMANGWLDDEQRQVSPGDVHWVNYLVFVTWEVDESDGVPCELQLTEKGKIKRSYTDESPPISFPKDAGPKAPDHTARSIRRAPLNGCCSTSLIVADAPGGPTLAPSHGFRGFGFIQEQAVTLTLKAGGNDYSVTINFEIKAGPNGQIISVKP